MSGSSGDMTEKQRREAIPLATQLFGGMVNAVGSGQGAGAAGMPLPDGGTAGMGGGMDAMFGPTAVGQGLFNMSMPTTPSLSDIANGATAQTDIPALGQDATAYHAGEISSRLNKDRVDKSMALLGAAGEMLKPKPRTHSDWRGLPHIQGAAPTRELYGARRPLLTASQQAQLAAMAPDERQRALAQLGY